MKMEEIIEQTAHFAKKQFSNAEGGHDWWHTYRVWQMSKRIAEEETCDLLVVELGALLHDIADSKFNNGNEQLGGEIAKAFLEASGVNTETIEQVVFIIDNISFKGSKLKKEGLPIELQIVQDADRLEAIGAIGIARCFSFGGHKNNPIYSPEIPPQLNMTKEEYKKSNGTSINHFYEKLLLLKELMNTKKGKEIAIERHQFMEQFLAQFFLEMESKA